MDWSQSEVIRLLKGALGTQYQDATDNEKSIMRDWIKSLLQTGNITVTFTKADGTQRDMLCTLDQSQIPVNKHPKVNMVVNERNERKRPDEHSIRVFDLEKNEWRSFRFDRLQKVTKELHFSDK